MISSIKRMYSNENRLKIKYCNVILFTKKNYHDALVFSEYYAIPIVYTIGVLNVFVNLAREEINQFNWISINIFIEVFVAYFSLLELLQSDLSSWYWGTKKSFELNISSPKNYTLDSGSAIRKKESKNTVHSVYAELTFSKFRDPSPM